MTNLMQAFRCWRRLVVAVSTGFAALTLGHAQDGDSLHSSQANRCACHSSLDGGDANVAHGHAIYAPGTELTPEDFVIQNPGWRWPAEQSGQVVITYSIHASMINGTLPGGVGCENVRAVVEEALGVWAKYAPLHFIEVVDSGPAPADGNYSAGGPMIRFGTHNVDGPLGSLAHAYYPSSQSNGLAGDVHLDSSETWAIVPGNGKYDMLEAIVHELGHALGLGHQPAPPEGVYANMNPFYAARFSGLGTATLNPDDIAGIRALYGFGVGSVRPSAGLACSADIPACPAEASLRAAFDLPLPKELKNALYLSGPDRVLNTFRKYRDTVLRNSALGNDLIKLYYQHSKELRQLTLADPKRTSEAAQLLMQTYPAVHAAVSRGGRLELDGDVHERILAMIDTYDANASPSLRRAIRSFRSALIENSVSTGSSVIIELSPTANDTASAATAMQAPTAGGPGHVL